MCSVCTPKGIRCLVWPQFHRPGLPCPRRPQGPRRPHLPGLSPRSADGLARHVGKAAIGHALWRWRGRGYGLPATRALLYIRVVTLGSLTIVPERGSSRRRARRLGGRLDLGGGLHIDRRGRDDHWWVVVGIWLVVWPPVRPQGDDDAGSNKDMPAAPCVPWYRARHEQRPHDPEDRQPLPSCGSCLGLVVHSTSLFASHVQALWYTPSRVHHHTPDDSDLATTEPIVMPWQGGGTPTIALSRHKCVTGKKNSRVARSSVLCTVDKRTQICNACIRAFLRSVGVDLTTYVFHLCHT